MWRHGKFSRLYIGVKRLSVHGPYRGTTLAWPFEQPPSIHAEGIRQQHTSMLLLVRESISVAA